MQPLILATLVFFPAALLAAPVSSRNEESGLHIAREDNNLVETRSVVDTRQDSETNHDLNTREVYFSQSYDWPESELIVHAYGRAAFFDIVPKDDNTYTLYFLNLGPANGGSYKFVFTAPGNDPITEVLAGGGTASPRYNLVKSDGQFKVEVSDP